ncbi:hypothetical protein ZWY2020_018626 [Hordeum vulgare]|nr:hypothetical protein ZWY2020_018626 [Hordeum vulgare]
MAFADTAARRLLRGGMSRRMAADAVSMSFGLDGFWQLIAGLLATAAHLLVMPFEVLGHWLQAAIAAVSHLVVLPFEALWHLLQSAAAGVNSCFGSLVAALGSAAHALAAPFEAVCEWLQAAAGSIASGFDGMCEHMQGIFSALPAALASAAHYLVVPFEAFWRWMQKAVAGISLDLNGFWPLVQGFVATAVRKADELVPALEAFWRWLKDTAVVALPFVLAIAAVVCTAVLVLYFWQILCTAVVQVAQALVWVLAYCGRCLYDAAMVVWCALAYLVPCCGQYCTTVTMAAPGNAGWLISRAAFEAAPALYFQIHRLAGPVVASAVFCTGTVASAVGASVAALFRL